MDALTVKIHRRKIEFGFGESLRRSAFEPFKRLGIILLDAHALIIEHAKPVFCRCQTLTGGFAVPVDGLGDIAFDAAAAQVKNGKTELGIGVADLGELLEFTERGVVIAGLVGGDAGFHIGICSCRWNNKARQ